MLKEPTDSRRIIFCSFCNEQFPSSKAMGEHLMLCGNKTDQCLICQKYVRRAILAYHREFNCAYPDTPNDLSIHASGLQDTSSEVRRTFPFPSQSKSNVNNTIDDNRQIICTSDDEMISDTRFTGKLHDCILLKKYK